jgi:phosphoribosylformylglycinamidine cyclo-ligase
MAPTRIYVRSLLGLIEAVPVKGMAHITGGGLLENIPRILPPQTKAVLARAAWPLPAVFAWLQEAGNIAPAEMQRTFNCGIGMAVIVAREDADRALAHLRNCAEAAWVIGEIQTRAPGEAQTQVR